MYKLHEKYLLIYKQSFFRNVHKLECTTCTNLQITSNYRKNSLQYFTIINVSLYTVISWDEIVSICKGIMSVLQQISLVVVRT